MRETRIGDSGWVTSSIGLGTLSWGRDIDVDTAAAMLAHYGANGGNLIEVAPHYGDGNAVSVLAELLPELPQYPQVLARIGIRQDGAPEGARAAQFSVDCSRRNLLNSVDALAQRLGQERFDCVVLGHYDLNTPLTEVAATLAHLISSGRTHYVGVANCPAWVYVHIYHLVCARIGPTPLFYEGDYSLLQRGLEREVLPSVCNLGGGLIASAPLASGVLTGKYLGATPPDSRAAAAHLEHLPARYLGGAQRGIVDAVVTAADGLGWSPLEVALAWQLGTRGVAMTLIGPRTLAQLKAYLSAADLQLPTRIREVLNEVSDVDFSYPDPAATPIVG